MREFGRRSKHFPSGDYLFISYKHQWNTRWAFVRKHDIFTHEIRTRCYLHLWKDHRCYGYITNRPFHTKKPLKWNGLVFNWCLYNKITLHGRLEIWNFSCAHSWNIFQHEKRKFVSPSGHVISSIYQFFTTFFSWLCTDIAGRKHPWELKG